MFIIECLPLSKSVQKESLSYFSSKNFEEGSIIKVPLRSKIIFAVVLESREAHQEKAELKSADFAVRKVYSQTANPFIDPLFLKGVKEAAEYFAVSPGSLLYQLIPSIILENPKLISNIKIKERELLPENLKSRVEAMQTDYEERFSHYKAVIREEFAKKRSIFICLPQIEDIRKAKEKLERGIEAYVATLHSGMKKNEIKEEWKKAILTNHPVVIISTANWLFLPRHDIGIIIIDQENKSGWKTFGRPFVDLRLVTEIIAHRSGIRTVLGDSFLRVETLWRYKQGEVEEFESVKWRLPPAVNVKIFDSRSIIKKEKEFRVLSEELIEQIKSTIDKGGNVFVYAARKGLAPSTICRDCGEQVVCGNCGSPMILYRNKSGNVFRCHQCGELRDAAELCKNCRSWKLTALGTGVDRVKEEIVVNFPNTKIFEIHKDATPTNSRATSVAIDFYKNRGSILLGTEMALSFLHKKVDSTAISAFDSLFSIPDFRIREKIFRLILEIRNLAKENFLLQTRNVDEPSLNMAINGNLVDFYKLEITEREALLYPPFSIFIKITARGTKVAASKALEELSEIFADWQPAIFPSLHEKHGEIAAINAVIKVPRSKWPKQSSDLLSKLFSLPPQYEIKIDPDNLL